MFKKILKEFKKDQFLMALLVAFLVFLVLYFISWGLTNTVFSKRAVLGLKINGISVSGETKEDIEKLLKDKTEAYKKGKIIVTVGKNKYEAKVGDFEPDYKIEEGAAKAIDHGKNTYDPREFLGGEILVTPSINEDSYQKFYKKIADKENTPYADAGINLDTKDISFTNEKDGRGVDDEILRKKILDALSEFQTEANADIGALKPKVTKKMLESAKEDIIKFLNKPLVIKVDKTKDSISKETLIKWLGFESDGGKVKISLKKDSVSDYLNDFSKKVGVAPKNAILAIKDGEVVVAVPSVDGKGLDIEGSVSEIIKDAFTNDEIDLQLKDVKAEVNEGNLSKLGITGLVSTGTSNFTGSPTNRIHNVKTGASKFNGVLIKPDEVFSFNKYLDDVDAANGYLPELVILQDKTVPQYGGGLCQVSSTAFRAALNAGMPIVARLNHSYPARYYYPIGADATIYLPNPDLKFKNNTGAYVLIQTSIYGNILRFDFYGTKPKGTITFSGNEDGSNAVSRVEDVKPYLFNQNQKGRGSVDSIIYRFIYDENGKLIDKYENLSKYDSPDKYPHPASTQ